MATSSLPAAVSGSIGNSTFSIGQPTVWDFGYMILDFIDTIVIPVVFAFALVAFLWGVYQYFIAGGADEEKRRSGRDLVFYSIIGFAVMVSVWGLVNLVVYSLHLNNGNHPNFPCLFGNCGGSGSGINIQIQI